MKDYQFLEYLLRLSSNVKDKMTEENLFYTRLKQEIKRCRKLTNQIKREFDYFRNSLHNHKKDKLY